MNTIVKSLGGNKFTSFYYISILSTGLLIAGYIDATIWSTTIGAALFMVCSGNVANTWAFRNNQQNLPLNEG